MTCSFLSILAATYMKRIDVREGFITLFPLLAFGLGTVVYWYLTDSQGQDDYKFYLFVQYFTPAQLACILALFPPRYSGKGYLFVAFGLYVAAKLLETLDYPIFDCGHAISGHTLKHITAAIACCSILRMLQVRGVIDRQPRTNIPPAFC